jgi:hypothetical protein
MRPPTLGVHFIMAKQKVFERVLEVLVAADGGAVTKEYLLKELQGDIVANRVSTYFWEIKTKAKIEVEMIKDGRKVVGYRLPVAAAPAPDGSAPDAPKVKTFDYVTDVPLTQTFYDGSLATNDN